MHNSYKYRCCCHCRKRGRRWTPRKCLEQRCVTTKPCSSWRNLFHQTVLYPSSNRKSKAWRKRCVLCSSGTLLL